MPGRVVTMQVLGVAAVLAMIAGYLQAPPAPVHAPAESLASPVPPGPSAAQMPIDTAEAATRRSLALLGQRGNVRTTVARRVLLASLIQDWYGTGFDDWDACAHVWTVGILADGLTRDDVLPPPPLAVFASATDTVPSPPVAGAYYVWHGPTGQLVAAGVIEGADQQPVWNDWSHWLAVGQVAVDCSDLARQP